MQIPIVSGIYADTSPSLRTSYPVNFVPVPKASGISEGFLRPADGIVQTGTGPGTDRGGINWNGVCYRVMGSKLVTVADGGAVTELGDVGDDGQQVSLDYSFDRLSIASAANLYYWDGALTQVTDPDLGIVNDVVWVDGYFMTTDGESLVVTELTDPEQVNPLKYGSSEADPDPVLALKKLRNEVAALNRHTIEFFDNVGGELFPFARIEGAQVQKGCIGTHACCVFLESIAFLGSGFNEEPSVYLGANGLARKIATQEIDELLKAYTDDELAEAVLEARNDKAHTLLYVHLPDRTLVYDAGASEDLRSPVWFVLTSALATDFGQYRARHMVWCYSKWLVGDPTTEKVGYLDNSIRTHWGEKVRWEFGTPIIYNESRGALFHELELVALTGSVTLGEEPALSSSYSVDGVAWSTERTISAGVTGERAKRLVWFSQGYMRNWRVQRFKGTSDAQPACIRLEGRLEPLAA